MRLFYPALRRSSLRWILGGLAGVLVLAAAALAISARMASSVEGALTRATGHRVTVARAALTGRGVVARDITVFGAPPFAAQPMARVDRLEVHLGGPHGLLSPSEVVIDGLDIDYMRAGTTDNVGLGRGRSGLGGGAGAGVGVRILVRSGRVRANIQPQQGPRVVLRARGLSLEVTAAGERRAVLEGLVAEVVGWLTATVPRLAVGSEARGATVSVHGESVSIIVPGGGPLVTGLALDGAFGPNRTQVTVTREPGEGKPETAPRVRATLRTDKHGGQLNLDADELSLRPLHAWLDHLGVEVDGARADLHLMATVEADRPEIPFELDLRARNFGVRNPSVDGNGWRDLPVELHAGGVLVAGTQAAGQIRIERGEIDALGAHLMIDGWTELGSLPRGSWTVRTPPGAPLACGRLLAGQPLPVREALTGMKLAGNLGLSVSVGFDAASWDALSLELAIDPMCEVVAEPSVLADMLGALVRGKVPPGAAAALPLGTYQPDFASLASMPAHLTSAFLTAEDGRFFTHDGFDLEMIRRALAHDLDMRAFAKGGSTITQQLAKNLFLPRSRTLARKLEETVLAWRLQTKLPRKRILELYLNIIELGPHIRGVKQAARAYFGKELGDLRPIESAHLAALTPNPQGLARRFRDGRVDDGWMQRLYDLLGMMNRSGRLSRSDLAAARTVKLTLRKI
jgi:hypothetical protein